MQFVNIKKESELPKFHKLDIEVVCVDGKFQSVILKQGDTLLRITPGESYNNCMHLTIPKPPVEIVKWKVSGTNRDGETISKSFTKEEEDSAKDYLERVVSNGFVAIMDKEVTYEQ